MPFTNVWDTTFPADTQLANLLGQDIRNFKLDIQQRMGVLSGLDASKPNFAGDTQPANWNGVLFFATDTGRIYQFNNPSWTDVTLSLGDAKFAARTTSTITGVTGSQTVYTVAIPAGVMASGTRVRVSASANATAMTSGPNPMTIQFGGSTIFTGSLGNGETGPTSLRVEGGNFGNPSAQTWVAYRIANSSPALVNQQVNSTAINTTGAVNVTLLWAPVNVGSSVQFLGLLVELF